MRRVFRSPLFPLSLAGLIALGWALLAAYATRWGPWGYSDTAAYVAAARNLAAGLGLRLPDAAGALEPSVLTPPFYTFVLALGVRAGLDALGWARAFAILLAFVFPAGLAWLTWRASGRAWSAPLLALAAGCLPAMFVNSVSAMSEGLFLCLGFGGLLLLLKQEDEVLSWQELLGSAALAGLAALTRYLGAAFILAGLLLVWTEGGGRKPGGRLARAALYGLAAGLPLLLWLAWTLLATRTLGARSLGVEPALLLARLGEFGRAAPAILSGWLPYGARAANLLPAEGKLLLLLALWAGALLWAWRWARRAAKRLLTAALGFSLAYLLLLALAYCFADVQPDLIPRMFSPLWPALWLALAASAEFYIHSTSAALRRLKWNGYILLALIVGGNLVYFAPQLSELARRGHTEGVGYTAKIWRTAPVFTRLAEMDGRALISDEPALLLLYTGRGAYAWDEWLNGSLAAAAAGPAPGAGAGRLDGLMRSGAALVIFPPRVEEEYGLDSRALLARWTGGLAALYRAPEAEILTFK